MADGLHTTGEIHSDREGQALAHLHWHCLFAVSVPASVPGIADCLPTEIDYFVVAFLHPSVLSPLQVFREQVHNPLEA
jgi:hypothetical protein